MLATAPMRATHAICACARMERLVRIDSNVIQFVTLLSALCGERAAWSLSARSPTQLGAQLLRHEVGIDAVANDLRPYENDELGSHHAVGALREGAAQQAGQLIKQRKAAAAALLPLADEACKQHGLAACNRDRALDLALGDGRGQRVGACRGRHIADLLLDVEADIAVDIDAR